MRKTYDAAISGAIEIAALISMPWDVSRVRKNARRPRCQAYAATRPAAAGALGELDAVAVEDGEVGSCTNPNMRFMNGGCSVLVMWRYALTPIPPNEPGNKTRAVTQSYHTRNTAWLVGGT